MTRVGVARLKAELSRYLDAAKQGQEILITERGRPVARLVALRGSQRAGSRRQRLARAGLLALRHDASKSLCRSWPRHLSWVM